METRVNKRCAMNLLVIAEEEEDAMPVRQNCGICYGTVSVCLSQVAIELKQIMWIGLIFRMESSFFLKDGNQRLTNGDRSIGLGLPVDISQPVLVIIGVRPVFVTFRIRHSQANVLWQWPSVCLSLCVCQAPHSYTLRTRM